MQPRAFVFRMAAPIPDHLWQPLGVAETVALFSKAPFAWAFGGGYAIEHFVGRNFRAHEDVDVMIFRDQQLVAQQWLAGWNLYAADPPGNLRPWQSGEFLPFGVHDIWAHRPQSHAWQFQFLVAEVDGGDWFFRRNPLIRGRRNELIQVYSGQPCVRIEVQLFFKSRGTRAKDLQDFAACLPLLAPEAKNWLREALTLNSPEGHAWLAQLDADH